MGWVDPLGLACDNAKGSSSKADDTFNATMRKVDELDFNAGRNDAMFYSGAGSRAKAVAFNKIDMNAVESDKGFVVRRKNRYELEYIEAENSLVIEVEPGDGLAVYFSTLECEDKDRIVKNICDGLDFLGIKYVVD